MNIFIPGNEQMICATKECHQISKSILESIDFNVDPCSDFYQFTCGGWIENTVLDDSRSSTGTLDTAEDNNIDIMRKILEGSYEDLHTSLFDSDKHKNEIQKDKQNFKTIQTYYNTCMDVDHIDALGPTPIYSDIAMIQNEHFPVKNISAIFSKEATPLISQTITALNLKGVSVINSFNVDSDDKNPDLTAIYFSQPSLGLPSKEYYEDEENIIKYRKGLNDVLYRILGDNDDAKLREKESKKVNFQLWSKEKVAAAAHRFIDFETKLASISLKNEDLLDPVKTYNPIQLSTFQKENSMIDWVSILKAMVPQETKLPETIILHTPEYYEQLAILLSTTKLITLQEYFVISFITNKVHALDKESRNAYQTMSSDIFSGTTAEQPRWRTCVEYTSNAFPDILGRYYVLEAFGTEKERIYADKFLTTIHEAWLNMLPGIDWLDKQTRKEAIEKVNSIKHKVGYSIASPDLRSPSSIENSYQGLGLDETSYYDTENMVSIWYSHKMWKRVGKTSDKNEWLMSPQTVNAYYSPNTNEIAIPAGILQSPFYNANLPEYLNYGGVGVVIGHELTHAFDNSGRRYNGRGNLTDWWTTSTSLKFDRKTQCFIDQYSRFNVTGTDRKVVNVNGKLTLDENLADNGGLAASLLAYNTLYGNRDSLKLSGLEQFSSKALFFINFGQFWCSKERDQVAVQMIYTDEHSPSHARVNGVVQNSKEFAEAFHCPAGSPMNPVKKCKMW